MPGNSSPDRFRADWDELLRSDERLGKDRFFLRAGGLAVANSVELALGNMQEGDSPPFVLLIGGESASGKTALSTNWNDVLNSIGSQTDPDDTSGMPWSQYISMDNYYRDNSAERAKYANLGEFYRNFDVDNPGALDLNLLANHINLLSAGGAVTIPRHDIATGISTPDAVHILPARFLLVEGLFALAPQLLSGLDDSARLRVFVKTSPQEIQRRWFTRIEQMTETANWRVPEAERPFYFDRVKAAAEEHVLPTEKSADMVLNGEASEWYQRLALSGLSRAMIDALR